MKTIFRFLTSIAHGLLTASVVMCTVFAYTQDTNKTKKSIVATLTRYELKPAYQDKFRAALSSYVLKAIATESNIMAEAYYEQENSNVLWLIERWVNSNELRKATGGMQFKAIETLAAVALVNPQKLYHLEDVEPLSKPQWRKIPKKEDSAFTVMLFVDAKPGTQDTFKDLYNVAMPKFRSEAGVITYQLSQLQEDATQFVTYEKFRNNAAFQYHLGFRPIEPIIAYLETSIKKPPFQSGLHRLVEFAPLTRE